MPTVLARIHRGSNEVGGSCVELQAHGSRLVLDIGLPLPTEPSEFTGLPPIAGLVDGDRSLVGVVLSRNWRRRVFQPAAEAAGLGTIRPYDLRHSFVSLLIAEGRNIVEVARQAGHSPSMALDIYGHVFDELDGDKREPAEEAIRKARAKVIREAGAPSVHPRNRHVASEDDKTSAFAEVL